MTDLRIFVQARMSSTRFPGKMLAPLQGRPVIAHVIERAWQVAGAQSVVLLTSLDRSDDPLAAYAATCLGVDVFRGDLHNVVGRFQACLAHRPCEWFVRICGDSPVIDPRLVEFVLQHMTREADLITNTGERTFPAGQSVEMVRSSTFRGLNARALAADEQEHVTLHYYRRPSTFRIQHVRSSDPSLSGQRLVVDSLEDLKRLESLLASESDWNGDFARFANGPL